MLVRDLKLCCSKLEVIPKNVNSAKDKSVGKDLLSEVFSSE